MQRKQHQADQPGSTPPAAVAVALTFGAVLEVTGEHRSVSLELGQHVAAEAPVRGQELAYPALVAACPFAAEAADPCTHERQILDRVDEGVPLEQRALLPEQPVEFGAVVAEAEPAEEDEMLRTLDRLDDVDLQEAEPTDGLEDARGRAVERLRA